MFERFTEGARQAVVLAQDEARTLKHNYIGTEHILLGLLLEGGAAAGALKTFDVTHEAVRAQVARIIGQGDEVLAGQIPFTPRAKKVLELSLGEALHSGHNYIGPEHVLLGLAREGEGVAARILTDYAPLEEIVFAVLGEARPPRRVEKGGRIPKGVSAYGPPRMFQPLLLGWVLFAVALGVGVLIGWAIWG